LIREVNIIGAGNVAFHLAHALVKNGVNVLNVVSRSQEKSQNLADSLGAKSVQTIPELLDADLTVIAVSDDSVKTVSDLVRRDQFTVHTSGTVPLDFISSDHRGVLYPLQTFSSDVALDFNSIPILVECNDPDKLKSLKNLCETISRNVSITSSEQRMHIHMAAVMACNFSNHLYRISESIVESQGMSFEILKPLILETAKKLDRLTPQQAQTGPAARGDIETINKHLDQLDSDPDLRRIYALITDSILQAREDEQSS
jgi:predicted short-subunit dehydrogenase-like oxidoreductase (DUF2520 family)